MYIVFVETYKPNETKVWLIYLCLVYKCGVELKPRQVSWDEYLAILSKVETYNTDWNKIMPHLSSMFGIQVWSEAKA